MGTDKLSWIAAEPGRARVPAMRTRPRRMFAGAAARSSNGIPALPPYAPRALLDAVPAGQLALMADLWTAHPNPRTANGRQLNSDDRYPAAAPVTVEPNGVIPGVAARSAAVGIGSGRARANYMARVGGLDPADSSARAAIKAQARAATPAEVRAIIEARRPALAPPPGSGGRANISNASVNRAGRLLGTLGKGAGLLGAIIAAEDILTSNNAARTTLANVGSGLGGILGGAGGAALGAATGPAAPVAAPAGGVAGSIAGGRYGYKSGEKF